MTLYTKQTRAQNFWENPRTKLLAIQHTTIISRAAVSQEQPTKTQTTTITKKNDTDREHYGLTANPICKLVSHHAKTIAGNRIRLPQLDCLQCKLKHKKIGLGILPFRTTK